MSDKEVVDHFVKDGKIVPARIQFIKDDYKEYLMSRFKDSKTLAESIYRIKEGLEKRPTCKVCGGEVRYTSKSKFADFCSVSCSKRFIQRPSISIQVDDGVILENLAPNGEINENRLKKKYLEEHGFKEYLDNRFEGVSKYTEIVYLLLNQYKEPPICPVCNTRKKFFDGYRKGYWDTCYYGRCIAKKRFLDNGISDKTVIDYVVKDGKLLNGNFKITNLKNTGIYDYIRNRFKDTKETTNTNEIIYRIINHIEEIPKCPVCNKPLGFLNAQVGYSRTCKDCSDVYRSYEHYRSKGFMVDINKDTKNLIFKNLCKVHQNIELTKEIDFLRVRLAKYSDNKGVCPICYPAKNLETSIETLVKAVLDEYNLNYIQHYRKLFKYQNGRFGEVDFWLPDKRIAIECNGEYWHKKDNRAIQKSIEKYNKLKELGIRLITIWENELLNEYDKIRVFLGNVFTKSEKISLNDIVKVDKEKGNPFIYEKLGYKIIEDVEREEFKLGYYIYKKEE